MSEAAQPPMLVTFFPFILIFFVFYFLIIRPQKRKEQEHKSLLTSLDKNDEIITTGGVYATIVRVKDSAFVIRIADGVNVEIKKSAVSTVVSRRKREQKSA